MNGLNSSSSATPSSAPSVDAMGSRVPVAALGAFIKDVMLALGMSDSDAATIGAIMSEADARGADAHGIFRLPMYVKRIQTGGINVRPEMKLLKERTGSALLDGDDAMGHLVMKRATDLAIEKAKVTGIGWVGVRNSNHAGPAGMYARMPLKHGMIGLYIAVGSANHMPPWGGTEMLLSTNPIAIAVPAGKRPPIVLDMATTTAAYGKVKAKAQRGEMMPEGWMVGRDGKPLLDPKRSGEGFLLPIGGPKGYGLALMFGLLAGTLNGAAFGKNVIDFNQDSVTPTNTGQAILALDVTAFMDLEEFEAQVDDVWNEMKSSGRLPGFDEIRLPGEQADQTFTDRSANGVPIHDELRSALDALADQMNVARLG
jgi:L-2-hydroxycarboxylate dehydrogenase (NAD+)